MSPLRPQDPRRPNIPAPRRPNSTQPQAARTAGGGQRQSDFGAFRASLLFCPRCRQATPTRERLLLVLPTGNLYEYLCVQCGTSTGSKTESEHGDAGLVMP
jgi:hypothetical protein